MQLAQRPIGVILLAPCLGGALLAGCTATRSSLVTATGTNIGVDISQDPATQTPHAKLGYQRVEMAIVPTNRSAKEKAGSTGKGAIDHGEVLMELRYGGIFDTGKSSGIYQRLAVGAIAVQQDGASLMFARGADGDIGDNAKAAVASLASIPTPTAEIATRKYQLQVLYRNGTPVVRTKIDEALQAEGFVGGYDDFVDNKPNEPSAEQMDKIESALRAAQIL